jgi:tetratricopeptide (TPR) repeat protein
MRFAFAIVIAVFAVQLIVTDVSLKLVHEDLQAGRFQSAMANYSNLDPWRPPGFSADLWYSRKLLESAQIRGQPSEVLEAATTAAVRATALAEDRHNAWYNLALVYSGQGNVRDAEASARKCIEVAPNWFKPYWLLSELYRAEGRGKEALSAGATAVDLNGARDPEVKMAYQVMVGEMGLSGPK